MARVREHAGKLKGARSVTDLHDDAEQAVRDGEIDRARRIWTWLAEIPGAGAETARERLNSLTEHEVDSL